MSGNTRYHEIRWNVAIPRSISIIVSPIGVRASPAPGRTHPGRPVRALVRGHYYHLGLEGLEKCYNVHGDGLIVLRIDVVVDDGAATTLRPTPCQPAYWGAGMTHCFSLQRRESDQRGERTTSGGGA